MMSGLILADVPDAAAAEIQLAFGSPAGRSTRGPSTVREDFEGLREDQLDVGLNFMTGQG
jgi:hypothetical protein